MRNRASLMLVSTCALLQVTAVANAEVKLPHIFADHMVLQADQPVRIWGQGASGEAVEVRFGGHQAKAITSKSGHWQITLPPLPASFQPQILKVKGDNEVTFADVLVGEVWLASGQSNMAWGLQDSQGGLAAIAASNDDGLRLFRVQRPEPLPAKTLDVDGAWRVSGPDASTEFSAVAYLFARRLRQTLQRPVGIIDSSWGGTLVEAWTSREGLAANVEGRKILQQEKRPAPVTPAQAAANLTAYETAYAAWEKNNRYTDQGNEGERQGFARAGIAEAGWQKVDVPTHWEDVGLDGDGAVWFRKQLRIPPQWVGQDLDLNLGVLNDCGTIYANGTKVGETCATPQAKEKGYRKPRRFRVPAELSKSRSLLVAVRVFDERGTGGFSSSADALFLQPSKGGDPLSLAGAWEMRAEKLLPTLKIRWELEPPSPHYPHANAPHALWDAMLAPLVPFGIKGAIWYQGEANVGRAQSYRKLFPAMIEDWRKRWKQGPFPFYFVQLAGFRAEGGPTLWPELREAQAAALNLPHTGMAVAIDIGNPTNIHPANKLDVAERLARWALGQTYGKTIAVSGPLYKRMAIQSKGVRLWFDHAQGLRVAPGETDLKAFQVAGTDRRFVPAVAKIEAGTVWVTASEVPKPVAVRYGWEGAPPCNLQNEDGLPASPFRTDNWPTPSAKPAAGM